MLSFNFKWCHTGYPTRLERRKSQESPWEDADEEVVKLFSWGHRKGNGRKAGKLVTHFPVTSDSASTAFQNRLYLVAGPPRYSCCDALILSTIRSCWHDAWTKEGRFSLTWAFYAIVLDCQGEGGLAHSWGLETLNIGSFNLGRALNFLFLALLTVTPILLQNSTSGKRSTRIMGYGAIRGTIESTPLFHTEWRLEELEWLDPVFLPILSMTPCYISRKVLNNIRSFHLVESGQWRDLLSPPLRVLCTFSHIILIPNLWIIIILMLQIFELRL